MSDEFKAFMCAILKIAELVADKTDNEVDDKVVQTLQFFLGCK